MSTLKKAKRMYEYSPDYAVPPGQTLREVIENLSMTQKDLALRTGLTEQTIVRIIKGIQAITFETANKLEMVTGVPARMWNNLEMQYREQLSRIKQAKELEQGIDWLQDIPTSELISRGVIHSEINKAGLVQETLKFYGVSSVEAWHGVWCDPKVAARRSDCFETQSGSASAWIRLGELQSQKIACLPFNEEHFKNAIQGIRTLTIKSPDVFIDEMRKVCADSGVALALVRELKKVPWNGASKWLSPNKAMILLNLRGKGEDIFWFSFFHEVYHILHGSKKELYIAEKNSIDGEEQEADSFAADILIPEKYNVQIAGFTSKQEILDLAKSLAISPGIVAGRFRHLTGKWTYFQDLTKIFDWTEG
ncbi:helix-turn-helix domain-containing protein [uncultured Sphaerochaeta sp.]|uniref:helix-turn-helix domain-containing protein n=1 Tax=uncultured Sphaerochaeta sp. TaxID=886478 RepID=UPI002A0A4950|nr:helix-turn-helix domain-containing protein [uncultured Sphaerochaeta sp.]